VETGVREAVDGVGEAAATLSGAWGWGVCVLDCLSTLGLADACAEPVCIVRLAGAFGANFFADLS